MGKAAWWPAWLKAPAPFAGVDAGILLQRLAASLVVLAALLLMGCRRQQFFRVRGQLDAPIQPVLWLGYNKPEPWTRFGVRWAILITLGTLVFLILGGRPAPASFLAALPLLPMVLLLATMNAFSEELTYHASLLGVLDGVIASRARRSSSPRSSSAWRTTTGVPYGTLGVLMSAFLGLDAGQGHARNARLLLGLIHPLLPGCGRL